MQADRFSLDIGALRLGIASEAMSLRRRVSEDLGLDPGSRPWPEALLLSRPAADGPVGTGMWVLYESGSIVLRRCADEAAATQAACIHLGALAAAVVSPLLPLRLRTLLLPDDTAVLAEPQAIHQLPGHDRRLSRRGVVVLPTTIALVDPDTNELVLPEQAVDPAIPVGRCQVSRIWLPDREETGLPGAATILGLARTLLRDPERDLQATLHQMDRIASVPDLIDLLPREEIADRVAALGSTDRG